MSSLNDILSATSKARHKLEVIQRERRVARLQFIKEIDDKAQKGGALKTITLAPDITFFFAQLQHRLHQDIHRYTPTPPVVQAPTPTVYSLPLQELVTEVSPFLQPPSLPTVTGDIPLASQYFAALLEEELSLLSSPAKNITTQHNQTALIGKLRQVQQALLAGRLSDCRTLLKNLQRSDPHNPTISFLLSQLEYLHVGMGQQGALPEAREHAVRSMTYSEFVTIERLYRYRYEAIVNELTHNPERALEWLRDSGMLNPELLQQEEGLTAFKGQLLMAWVILAHISPSLWQDTETAHTHTLVTQITGGALIYLALLRQSLLQECTTRNTPLAHVSDMEHPLQLAWLIYNDQANAANLLKSNVAEPTWLVKVRYGQALLSCLTFPSFDQLLLHIALSGTQWLRTYPTHPLQQQLEDRSVYYWRQWALTLATLREKRQNHLIPFTEMQEDLDMVEQIQGILQQLREFEQSLIFTDTWEDLKPFMVRWSLDHLLAAGTGSNKPRLGFTPSLAPYTNLYNQWAIPTAQGILGSDIIFATAQRGAFASWFEVLAAIEGAARLADDPVHGIKSTQKSALAQARQQDPEKFAHVSMENEGLSTPIQLLFTGIFFVAGCWAAFALTANWGQAAGLLLTVVGISGALFVRLLARSA